MQAKMPSTSVVLFLDRYSPSLPQIETVYPGGKEHDAKKIQLTLLTQM